MATQEFLSLYKGDLGSKFPRKEELLGRLFPEWTLGYITPTGGYAMSLYKEGQKVAELTFFPRHTLGESSLLIREDSEIPSSIEELGIDWEKDPVKIISKVLR